MSDEDVPPPAPKRVRRNELKSSYQAKLFYARDKGKRKARRRLAEEERPKRIRLSFDGERRAVQWLIEQWLPTAEFGAEQGLIGGPEKSFKSHLVDAMVAALVSGRPFLGRFPVPRPVKVLVIIGEGGTSLNEDRMMRHLRGHGLTPGTEEWHEVTGRLYAYSLGAASAEAVELELEELVAEHQPDVVVVDCLYAFAGGVERQLHEIPVVLRNWVRAVDGRALLIVDHFRKVVRALTLASLSGSGTMQWVGAWSLQRCEHYHAKTDTAVLKVNPASRIGDLGTWRVTMTGVDAADVVRYEVEETSPDEDDELTAGLKLATALEVLEKHQGAWMPKMELMRQMKLSKRDLVNALVESLLQADEAWCAYPEQNGQSKFWFALRTDAEDGGLPGRAPGMPRTLVCSSAGGDVSRTLQ